MDSVAPAVENPTGEFERLVRSFDWSATALGPIAHWPRGLRAVVDAMLGLPLPAIVLWGPQLVQIYNDAYRVVAGARHPTALGQPTHECWSEIVDQTAPVYRRVLAGESISLHHGPFAPSRSGAPDEAGFTVGYSPLRDDEGRIAGLLAILCATTNQGHADRVQVAVDAERKRLEDQRTLALDAAQLGWWRLDVAEGRVYWDDRLPRIFGVDKREWVYADVVDCIHPDDRAYVDAAVQEALDPRSAGRYAIEYRVVHPDGSIRWVQSRGATHFEGEGDSRRAVSLAGTAADVTEVKTSAAALKASAERLSLALAAARLGDWEWDAKTDVMNMSVRAAEIYGVPAGPWGKRAVLRDLLHPDDRLPAKIASDRAAATHTDYDVEYRVQRPDGREVWVAAKGRGLYDENGEITHMLGVVQDVTARKKSEQEREGLLEKAAVELARLNEAFRQSPAFMCVQRGPQHVYEFVNEQYMQLIHRRDVIGKTLREALPELEGQGVFELLDEVYRTGERFVGQEMRVLMRGAADAPLEEYYLDFVYQPIIGADGAITGVFTHGVDVTESKRIRLERERLLEREQLARAEAEQANRMKDDFLATLSHELRTPLNAIVGWSQLMRRGVRAPGGMTDEMIAEGVETIERNALAQARIIEDLLDMSRIISGKIRLDVQRVDIVGPVRAGVDTIRPAAQAKAIRIVEELDAPVEPVIGDPNRLQQVFWNLLSNAVKFTPPGGRVRISLRNSSSDASRVEVTVADDGMGINPAFLPHVFDRFRQADSSTTRKHGGLGLGLAIVRQLVELHGGTVRAHSDGEHKGAAFTVSLPSVSASGPGLTDGATGSDSQPEEASRPTTLQGVTVLVVDDEADGRAIIKRILEHCGAVVETASSGREALERLEAASVDVLVSDVGMPEMDGYELLNLVRSLPPDAGGTTPALALTAYVRSEDRVRALRAGFNMYLVKPVDPLELLNMVAVLAGVNE